MFITLEDLVEYGACKEGQKEFKKNFPNGIDVYELVKKLEERKDHKRYIEWLFSCFKLTGICRCWYSNGNLHYEYNIRNGRQHGICREWYGDGTLWFERNYKDGRLLTDEE